MGRKVISLQNFADKYIPVPESGCWLWLGTTDKHGYAKGCTNYKTMHGNRLSWLLHNGEIPENHFVKNSCGVRSCVNPSHLVLIHQDELYGVETRFHRSYTRNGDGCWLWTGRKGTASGYGVLRHRNKGYFAHRIAWQLFNGPIPNGRLVLHRCDVRLCINPDHLFLGSHDDNMKDMAKKDRSTHGERSYMAKLKSWEVSEIKALKGAARQQDLAWRYGVDRSTIASIHCGKTWTRIQPSCDPRLHRRLGTWFKCTAEQSIGRLD